MILMFGMHFIAFQLLLSILYTTRVIFIIATQNMNGINKASYSTKAIKEIFYSLPLYAVVGASTDREKFGNKVLRCYQANNKQVIPINKRQDMIENISCYDSLTTLSQSIQQGLINNNKDNIKTSNVGISIITPPGVTKLILEEGIHLGYQYFYLQPGTYDQETKNYIDLMIIEKQINIIQGCVLVDLNFSH